MPQPAGELMRRTGKKKTPLSRKDFYTIVNLAAMMGALIFRIPLGFMIGEKGLACFGTANEIFLVTAGTVSYGLMEAVAAQVRYRIKRQQYQGAGKALRGALLFGGGLGLALCAVCVFGGGLLAEKAFHIPLAGMAVSLMAPSLFFFILTGVFRGYFQGNGSSMPAMHSQILYVIFLFTGGLIGAGLWRGYGEKVSAFLQNPDCTGAYGAMGACIGLLTGSVLCFLHVLVLYIIFRHSQKHLADREVQMNQESGFRIFSMLLGAGLLHSLYWFCYHALPLLDQYLIFTFAKETGGLYSLWGAYYGKCLAVTGVASGGVVISGIFPIRRIMASLERGEGALAKERLGTLVHQCAVFIIPAAVFIAVLAENILALLPGESGAQAVPLLQLGSLGAVVSVFANVFMEILIRNRKLKFVIGIGAVSLVLHIGCALALVQGAKLGMVGIVVAEAVFFGAAAIMGFLLIGRIFQYTQEWIRCFAFTAVAAAVSGFIALVLNKVLFSLIGAGFSLLLCLAVGIVLYMVFLVVLRAFKSRELEEMAGGGVFSLLAELLHFN